MNKNKPNTGKRVVAYIIDLLIVTVISGIISIVFINNEKYNEDSKRLLELTKEFSESKIEREEYIKLYDELNYDLTKDSVSVTIVTCGVSIVYFVVMCYFCHGITLGKYLMKLRIVSNNDKELNLLNYFLRSLIVNMVLSNVLSIVLVSTLSKSSFITVYSKVSNIITLIMLVSFIFIMYREDGRGIEDFMGCTKVIDMKKAVLENENKTNDNKDNETTDAEVIKEKKSNRGRKKKVVK